MFKYRHKVSGQIIHVPCECKSEHWELLEGGESRPEAKKPGKAKAKKSGGKAKNNGRNESIPDK